MSADLRPLLFIADPTTERDPEFGTAPPPKWGSDVMPAGLAIEIARGDIIPRLNDAAPRLRIPKLLKI